jgi:hypothetical protein
MKHTLFSYLFVAIAMFLFAGIGAMNYVIDPYGYNNAFHFKINAIKKTQNERNDKFKLLSTYPHATSFIFGSSRALRLNPGIVTSLTGNETLNTAFCGASADEYYLYIKYLIQTKKVKNIIISIDLFAYADGYESDSTLPESLLSYFHLNNEHHISSYFSYDTLQDSVKTIKVNRKVTLSSKSIYTSHGQAIQYQYIDALKDKELIKRYTQRNVLDQPPYWNTRRDTLSNERLSQLIEIKKLCDQNGIHLYLFMNPLWIKQITMKQNKFFLQKKLLQYIVKNIQPVWDYNGITTINTDPYAYQDQFHFSCVTGDSILTEILSGKPLIGNYAGTYVTQQNISEYLDQTDQRLQKYLKTVQ